MCYEIGKKDHEQYSIVLLQVNQNSYNHFKVYLTCAQNMDIVEYLHIFNKYKMALK